MQAETERKIGMLPELGMGYGNGAARHDKGKTEFHLLPFDALGAIGDVCTMGAKKYAPRNWERGMLWSRCFNSLLRHLFAWWNGEDRDQESGSSHLAHAAWNAIALLAYSIRGIGEDDRAKHHFITSEQQNLIAANSSLTEPGMVRIDGKDPIGDYVRSKQQ